MTGPSRADEPTQSHETYQATVLDPAWTGDVLRFGPGVPTPTPTPMPYRAPTPYPPGAAPYYPPQTTYPVMAAPPPSPPERRGGGRGALRRYGPAAIILIAVIAYLLWQRGGPRLAVETVSAAAEPAAAGCDAVVEVTALVRTNGGPGVITYEWLRSDGGTSGVLRERVPRGHDEARLRLRWSFQGEGTMTATAELRVTAPTRHTATAEIAYACP
ncbi:hypothetical protein [Streptomyces sp. NBC_01803]|uniref:hypothetical protein n=1 Tax=Streptomyces sp. NBC_01803 TaxID=2975946 RepID=UPI002DDB9675|nr:hypothetical protein [Streptomyces sp. NBC_01803]WSA46781.1 hypothetical protein OIE51_22915 [Streptomyces sp. NBC_01803]